MPLQVSLKQGSWTCSWCEPSRDFFFFFLIFKFKVNHVIGKKCSSILLLGQRIALLTKTERGSQIFLFLLIQMLNWVVIINTKLKIFLRSSVLLSSNRHQLGTMLLVKLNTVKYSYETIYNGLIYSYFCTNLIVKHSN